MTKQRAKELRQNATEAERKLWHIVRDFKRAGMYFRRQVPIGPYFADFACHSAKLIIELDGSQYGDEDNRKYDANRTTFMESEGYCVIRIWNNELFADPRAIADFVFEKTKQRLPGGTK